MDTEKKTKVKTIKKLITFSEGIWDMVESLQEKNSYLSTGDAVRNAIIYMYNKQNPEYVQAIRDRASKTPEDRAEDSVSKAEAKIKAKDALKAREKAERVENGRRIAGELRGEITVDEKSGDEKCTYYSYAWVNAKNASFTERTKYLDELTDEDIEFQFYNNTIKPKQAMPSDQVIATLVDLNLTDAQGRPI